MVVHEHLLIGNGERGDNGEAGEFCIGHERKGGEWGMRKKRNNKWCSHKKKRPVENWFIFSIFPRKKWVKGSVWLNTTAIKSVIMVKIDES